MTDKKSAWQWDFAGSYAPGSDHPMSRSQKTFSVGVFQWQYKSGGRGLKRGPVVKRFKGLCSDPQSVFEAAQAECDRRNQDAVVFSDGSATEAALTEGRYEMSADGILTFYAPGYSDAMNFRGESK